MPGDPRKAIKAWYPWAPADYLRDTLHLSELEDLAYRRLLDSYWINQGPLKDDDDRLRRTIRYTPEQWAEVREAMLEYFPIAADGLRHNVRADKEIVEAMARYMRRAKAGSAGGRPRSDDSNAKAMLKPGLDPDKAMETSNDDDDDDPNPLDSFNGKNGSVVVGNGGGYEVVFALAKQVRNAIPEKRRGRRLSEIEGYVAKWIGEGYLTGYILDATKLAVRQATKDGDVITSPKYIEAFFSVLKSREV